MPTINDIRPKTVFIVSILTAVLVIVFFDYQDKSRADKISLTDSKVILTYPKKEITIDYAKIDKVLITCGKSHRCGVVIQADKEYRTKFIISSDNAKKMRDEINQNALSHRKR